MTAAVLGLDLSLTSTGVAYPYLGGTQTVTIKPRTSSFERLRDITLTVMTIVEEHDVDLVVVEGPSYGSVGPGQHERGGLWWIVCETIDSFGVPIAVMSPAALKKYATGSGAASKDAMMLAAARRFPDFNGDNNAADALFLRAAGCDHIGAPIVTMPANHRDALAKVAWPDTKAAA